MERFTFEEIKAFVPGDIFWARNSMYVVDDTPKHYNKSNFYGDFSESIEWTAICQNSNQQHKFQVSNIYKDGESETLIFKTSTVQEILGSSNGKRI